MLATFSFGSFLNGSGLFQIQTFWLPFWIGFQMVLVFEPPLYSDPQCIEIQLQGAIGIRNLDTSRF